MSVSGSTSTGSSSLSSQYAQLINSIIASQSGPLNDVLARQARLAAAQGAMSDLGSKLSALRTTLDGLRSQGALSPLAAFTSTTGNSQVVTASPNGGAVRGSHQISISQLAQAHTLAGGVFTKTGSSFTPGTYQFSLSTGGVTTNVNVTVNSGDSDTTVLANVAQAINASGAKVNASVITTDPASGSQKLILQSGATGVVNLISNVSDVTGGLAAQLGIAGTSSDGNYSAGTLQQAKDAKYNLDGVDLVSSTNQVSDALSGVTINLLSKSDTPVNFNIATDSATTRKALDNFLTQYNDLVTYLRGKMSISDDGKTRGDLAGNSTFESFLDRMRNITFTQVTGAVKGAPQSLGDLGITPARDGTLSVSSATKFQAALDANPAQFIAVFSGDQGIGGQLYSMIDSFNGSKGGLSIQTQALTDQSTELTSRAKVLQVRLDMRRAQLVTQFTQLQTLATQISQQQQQLGLLSSFA